MVHFTLNRILQLQNNSVNRLFEVLLFKHQSCMFVQESPGEDVGSAKEEGETSEHSEQVCGEIN